MFSKTFSSRVVEIQNGVVKDKPFPKQSLVLTALQKRALENIVGKGENAGNQEKMLVRVLCKPSTSCSDF